MNNYCPSAAFMLYYTQGGDCLRKLLTIFIIFSMLLFAGCRQKDPFRNHQIDFSEFSSSEISAIKQIESELTYNPEPEFSTNDVTLLHFTDTVKRGLPAEITIKGKPNTVYTIKITYSSGASKSKSLGPQTSDKNGIVAWRWTVGAKTKVGVYPVEIFQKDNCKIKTKITVTNK